MDSKFGKAPDPAGSKGTLDGLPGRMAGGKSDKSSFSKSSSGPSPAERLSKANSGMPVGGKGPGRGSNKT